MSLYIINILFLSFNNTIFYTKFMRLVILYHFCNFIISIYFL
uniref:Uncharacterized protein n=1 Tax=viral metagenome TaxID=1070528 RepID=A0A6C0IE12_9ZZZZ